MSALAKIAFAIVAVLMLRLASATSIGVIVGAPSFGASAEASGVRERVALVHSGGRLVGRPKLSAVQLLVIDAPNVGVDHLLMREIRMLDGRLSVLFTAPAALTGQVRKMSLYLKEDGRGWVVLESLEGRTLSHASHPVAVARSDADGAGGEVLDQLLGFSVEGLGPFWLVDENSAAMARDTGQAARSLLGHGAVRALSYIGVTVLLLILGRILSLWAHRQDRHVS